MYPGAGEDIWLPLESWVVEYEWVTPLESVTPLLSDRNGVPSIVIHPEPVSAIWCHDPSAVTIELTQSETGTDPSGS